VFLDGSVLLVVRAVAALLGFEPAQEIVSAHRGTAAGLHGVSASTEAVEMASETKRAHAWLPLTDNDAWFGDVPAGFNTGDRVRVHAL